VTAADARPYPLDSAHPAGEEHLGALAKLLDGFTQGRLDYLTTRGGARCLEGARVLEVGAGAGSIAGWLARRVGPAGLVVATDLKVDHLGWLKRDFSTVSVVQHDLTSPAWPRTLAGPFDLIHVRLTLGHLPQRREILRKLVRLLAPGGVLIVEDWAGRREAVIWDAPDAKAAELYRRYQHHAALVFDAAGTDRTWAPSVFGAMREEGLEQVDTKVEFDYWRGGGPGMTVVAATLPQLRPKLLNAGMTSAELDDMPDLLANERLVVEGHPLYSTTGIRPH
jgi:ubiquinone/menaquinone biosynthesis C-methylase UbiE